MVKPLPIDVNDFETIINGGYVYVDKTKPISILTKHSSLYEPFHFLARPRGFGKSLLVSTIEALFRNKKALFEGTEIYKADRKWTEHPIIKIDVSTLPSSSPEEFESSLWNALKDIARSYGLPELQGHSTEDYVRSLMKGMKGKFSERVVILIDESDHPSIENFVPYRKAYDFARILTDFHVNLHKFCDNVEFSLTTGVHTVAAFIEVFGVAFNVSGSLAYETIMGFTEKEMEQYFGNHLEEIALSKKVTKEEVYKELRSRYYGYQFGSKTKVLNPYSVLCYLKLHQLQNFWTDSQSTSSTTILQHLIRRDPVEALVCLRNRENNYYRVGDRLDLKETGYALKNFMFQNGYFTIETDRSHVDDHDHIINFANQEVREAYQKHFEQSLTIDVDKFLEIINNMEKALRELRVTDFISELNEYMSMTANFPFPECMYNKKCRTSNRTDTTWDLERKEERFWLNFHTALRITGAFKKCKYRSQKYQTTHATIKKIDGEGPCYVFELSTTEKDPLDTCVKLDKDGRLDNFYDRTLKVPVICMCITFDAGLNKIVDWKAIKFSRVTTYAHERIE